MLAATLIGIFIVPVFYVVLQGLVERPQPGVSARAAAEPTS
jgi:hypothetical protein